MVATAAGVSLYRVALDATVANLETEFMKRIANIRAAGDVFLRSAAVEAGGNSPTISVASAAAAIRVEADALLAAINGDAYNTLDDAGSIAMVSA